MQLIHNHCTYSLSNYPALYCLVLLEVLTMGGVQQSNDGGHVCQVENLKMDSNTTEGNSQEGFGSLHTEWSDDTVINQSINQWWGRIRSVPGNNTLPLIISATMQPTDHTSTAGGRLGDREVDMQIKWWGEKKHKESEKNANRMAVVWWCVEIKMESMQPDIWEKAMQC